jgi:hypothetical protein
VADELRDRTNVVSEFLGERQRFTDQTREALAQRVIEALDMIGFQVCFAMALCRSAGWYIRKPSIRN